LNRIASGLSQTGQKQPQMQDDPHRQYILLHAIKYCSELFSLFDLTRRMKISDQ